MATLSLGKDDLPTIKLKSEDDLVVSPFLGIEKGAVLQECRIFNDLHLKPRKCVDALVRLLYLVGQGEKLSSSEATEVFFSITKLFQSNEPTLRRLVYLSIKELAGAADEVIIVTNCLMKDVNSREDMYRANATRVLCRITDSQMVSQIERYLKQEIVDRNPVVASAALVSGQHLLLHNKGDVVRRWISEITQALEHPSPMVQYHALALLYQIRQHDRLAVSKLVQGLARSGIRSAFACCLLIRCILRIIGETSSNENINEYRPFFEFIESCLRHPSDMVVCEAARAIISVPGISREEVKKTVTIVNSHLLRRSSVVRHAALRILNKATYLYPNQQWFDPFDFEDFLHDKNRAITTLAIATVLRGAREQTIEGFLKKIQSKFMELPDEFRVQIVEAVHSLVLKYPNSYYSLLNFLGSSLREEGGFDFKRAVVDAYFSLLNEIPQSKEICLTHLCEFIEDCEHPFLSARILHLLGQEGPKMSQPGKYIRYIYNRIILENAAVRAAAVSSLARFLDENSTSKTRKAIVVLLKQCLHDSDDEVRDRASYFLHQCQRITDEENSLIKIDEGEEPVSSPTTIKEFPHLPYSLPELEGNLVDYLKREDFNEEFNVVNVPKAEKGFEAAEQIPMTSVPVKAEEANMNTDNWGNVSLAPSQVKEMPSWRDSNSRLSEIEELASLGIPLKTSSSVELTEPETEYNVTYVKHTYRQCIVLEFIIVSTLEDQILENVHIITDLSSIEGLQLVKNIPVSLLKYGSPQHAFVVLQRLEGFYPIGDAPCEVRYVVKEMIPSTGEVDERGFDEEYKLEDLSFGISDYMVPLQQSNARFKDIWDKFGSQNEVRETFALSMHQSIPSALNAVRDFLGMTVVEGAQVSPYATQHVSLFGGSLVTEADFILVVCYAEFVKENEAVILNLTVRSEDLNVSELVCSAIA
ncbi:Coatomer subunit gamma [Galdieria sulphuraria]|nr:Coatomer subunit gamma [Galdieria sulphuraria]